MDEKMAGQIRHLMGALGAVAVAFNLVDAETAQALTGQVVLGAGAVASIAAMVWSWWAKRNSTTKGSA